MNMAKSKTIFVCNECGNESSKWLGKCPACNSWNSFFEQKVVESKDSGLKQRDLKSNIPQKLNSYEAKETIRTSTGFGELDRVLGRRISERFIGFTTEENLVLESLL
jgi:DNA repair protein RadA/Sms